MSTSYPPPDQPGEPWPPQGSYPPPGQPGQPWPPQGSYPPAGQPGQPWPPQYPYPPTYAPPADDPLISPDYSGWSKRGLAIFRRGWKPLAALQGLGLLGGLLGLLPVGIYVAFMWGDLRDLFAAKSGTQVDPGPFLGLWGALMLVGLVASVWSLIISLATVHVGASVAVGAPVRIGHSIRFGARRMFPLAGWGLLTVPIYLVAICLCILPVFYIAAVFTVLTTVVAAERTNAISRCFTLFHNDWRVSLSRIGTIFGISMAASAVVSTVGVPFQLAYMQSLMNVSSTNPHLNLSGGVIAGMAVFYALSFVIQALLPMVVSPLTLAAYADMRARVEPLTSAQIAQELGITA